MNKTILALGTALLLAGGAPSMASAQTTYYDSNGVAYVDNDVDNDGIANQYDRFDNRYDQTVTVVRPVVGIDRDCDGVPDLYDPDARNLDDADCDGIPNRFDRRFGQPYTLQRHNPPLYVESSSYRPRYQYVRYNVGGYLPASYVGERYYIDDVQYSLTPPPYGYHWVRVGKDVYLVSTDNGLISQVVYDFFH
jgi:Ni/Co efflux regulator RcnB